MCSAFSSVAFMLAGKVSPSYGFSRALSLTGDSWT